MSYPITAAFLSCQGISLTDNEKYLLEQTNPVGITLFARNIKTRKQLQTLVNELKQTIGRDDLLIAVDQEGGRVRRLTEPEFFPCSAQADLGQLPLAQAQTAAALQADIISSDLKSVGINVNFAPVLDLAHPNTTEALRSRCFSDNPDTVAALGQTMINHYMSAGILPCIKHLPGHGLATNDPHLSLPIINASVNQLQIEMQPFCDCNFAPLGMTAHILLSSVDTQTPLTQSAVGIKTLIRDTIGFNGFLISDAIDMKALKGSVTDKAERCLNAGCDCICYCMADPTELQALAAKCPKLSDAASERLDKALQTLHNTQSEGKIPDIKAYQTLMGQVRPYQETYDATEVLHNLTKGTKNV